MRHYAASELLPLPDMQEEWERRLRMIDEAQQFLYASTYFLHYDRYGREFMDRLAAACRRGVKVVLLIDGFGQVLAGNLMTPGEISGFKKAVRELESLGATVQFYRCRRLLQRLLGSGMHIKIQLSDQKAALFSSGNISATSYEQWREFSVLVRGHMVTALLEEFIPLGIDVNSEHLSYLRDEQGGREVGYLSYNPCTDKHTLNPLRLAAPNALTDYLIQKIGEAKRSIVLTSFYFKPEPQLLSSLLTAAKRGVKIEIFHSHRDALGPSVVPWIPSFYLYPRLLDAGIAIYENRRGEHSKLVLIDDSDALFGSYNFEYASHDRVAEAMMHTKEPEFLSSLRSWFETLRNHPDNERVTKADRRALPLRLRARIVAAKPFCRWL